MKRNLVVVIGVLALLSCRISCAVEMAPQMVIQRGHVGQITRVAISSDGEFMASSTGGDPIKLWQAQRGEFIRDLPNSIEELPLAWSPDGSTLLTAARDINYAHARPTPGVRLRAMPSGKIISALRGVRTPLWFNGKIIRTTDGKTLRDWSVADGKLISTRRLETSLRRASTLLWDGETPRVVETEGSLEDNADERYFSFSHNGKFLVFGGEFGTNRARVWDANSGRLLHEIYKKDAAFGLAAVSDDGNRIVTQGEDPNWTPPGPDSPGTEASYARTFTVHLWDLKTEKEIRVWPGFYSLTGGAWLLKFSRDGKRVFGGGHGSANVYDGATGKVRKVEASGFQDISDDENLWANGDINDLRLTSIATGKVLNRAPGVMRGGDALAFSPDGKYLAGGSHLHLWNMSNASLPLSPSRYLLRSHWLNDSTLQTENLNAAHIWKIESGGKSCKRVSEIAPAFPKDKYSKDSYSDEVFLSPDGKTLLSNAKDFNKRGTLYVWDSSGKKLLKTIEVNKRENGSVDNVGLTWLPDSKRFVTSSRSGIEIWNVALGKRETLLTVPKDYPPPANPDYPYSRIVLHAISPDGKYFATSNPQGEAHGMDVWDMTSTPRRLCTLPTKLRRNASFSPDGEWLAIGDFYNSSQGRTEVWKWREDRKPRFILPVLGLTGRSTQEAPAWSPGGKRLAIGAEGATNVFDMTNGKLLAQLAIGPQKREITTPPAPAPRGSTSRVPNQQKADEIAESDWLIWTPEGFFSAPDGGKKRVRWMDNGVLLPLDSPRDKELRKQFLQPQKVGHILQGEALQPS